MIHTLSIKYEYPMDENAIKLLRDLAIKPSLTKKIDSFITTDRKYFKFFTVTEPGIESIIFYKPIYDYSLLHMVITVDCEALCLGRWTLELFEPNINNIQYLQHSYALAMLRIFPSLKSLPAPTEGNYYFNAASVPYIFYGKIRRIDYAYNLHPDNKDLFLKMARNSFCHPRRKLQNYNNNNIYAVSKRKKFSIYDKERYITSHRNNREDLLDEDGAGTLCRYELPIIRPDVDFVYKWNRPNGITYLPLHLLCINNDAYLQSEYTIAIGRANWYSEYNYTKRLEAFYKAKPRTAKILTTDMAYIISQSRTITNAKKNYIKGTYKISKTGKIVKGTKITFNNHMREYTEAHVQPLRICINDRASICNNPINTVAVHGTQHNLSNVPKIDIPDYYNIVDRAFNIFLTEIV